MFCWTPSPLTLQVKPERWTCIATSFAMVLGIPVSEFIQDLGHNGSSIIWPSHPEPNCRRGHHIQECIAVCVNRGYAVTPIELFPTILRPPLFVKTAALGPTEVELSKPVLFGGEPDFNWVRFVELIKNSEGVLTGYGRTCHHAVANSYGRIYDPDGEQYEYSREACEQRHFYTQCLWKVDRLIT